MLSKADNELLCRVGPGTRMGDVFRRFWNPVCLAEELKAVLQFYKTPAGKHYSEVAPKLLAAGLTTIVGIQMFVIVGGVNVSPAEVEAVLLAAPKTLGCNSKAAFFVDIECVFARPKSHLRRNGLASDAPRFPPRCDWDNLGKGICDAITGAIWMDDDQVVDGRCRKRYAEPGEEPHTVIRWGRV